MFPFLLWQLTIPTFDISPCANLHTELGRSNPLLSEWSIIQGHCFLPAADNAKITEASRIPIASSTMEVCSPGFIFGSGVMLFRAKNILKDVDAS